MTNNTAAEPTDVLEERLIDNEYKIWKKNTPYLYDFVMTHSLEWPSLTCQWLPPTRSAGPQATEHQLLLGTHTNHQEQNYLMVATCAVPKDEQLDEATTPPPRYDEEKKEFGGFGHAHSNVGKIEIKIKIKHEGEVNRARYMPDNHFIVATRGPKSEVYIWDFTKHSSFPPDDSVFCPQGVCIGHEAEGYAMSWSPHQSGLLATGSEDKTVRIWDVTAAIDPKTAAPGTQIKAKTILSGHTETVEDVDWHPKDPNMLVSVGDDKNILVWDPRDPSKPVKSRSEAHAEDINCVSWNPVKEHMFCTGSADKTVAVWDLRNLESRIHTLQGHTDQVYMVDWAPFNESILGSCSADRRVAVWDLSRIGMEQSPEDAEDGPPELLFLHGGHTSKVSDFSWNGNDHWTVASISEDNVLQVWNMAEEIYTKDDEAEDDEEGEGLEDDELED